MKTVLLSIEAVIAGAPCMVLAAGGLPIFLYAGFGELSYAPISGAESILAAVAIAFALLQYCLLAAKTIQSKPYRFGVAFWVAVPCAVFAVWGAFGGFFNLGEAVFLTVPITCATLHFVFLQWRITRLVPPGVTNNQSSARLG